MPTRNISLTPELDNFIAERIESGSYESASEVVRSALRSMERRARRDTYIKQAIAEGMASGIAEGDVVARVREEAGLSALVR